MKFRLFLYCTIVFFSQQTYCQPKFDISLGAHFPSAGGKSSLITNNEYRSVPYIGTGFNLEFSYLYGLRKYSDTGKGSVPRWFGGFGIRANYTPYGFLALARTPFQRDREAMIVHINPSLTEQISFRVTQSMIIDLTLMQGYRFTTISGDSVPINIYHLRNADGTSNISKISMDIGIGVSFKIIPKLYANIGFVHGLTSILKQNPPEFPKLREFYPSLRIKKYI